MSNLSPAPGTPQTPAKAITAAVSALVLAGLAALLVALQTNAPGEPTITAAEWVVIAIAVVGSPILAGGSTYYTQNKPVS